MSQFRWKPGFAVAAAMLLFVSACSDDDGAVEESFECGAGTVLKGGECVLDEYDCPEGQVASPLGRCEDPDIFCGDGAAYDVEEKACLSLSDVVCGEGTIQDGEVCRVEDPLYCGPGTVLADAECVLSEEVCGPGTELDTPHCELDEATACDGRTEWDVVTGTCVDLGAVECGDNTVEVDDACLPMSGFADELAADADSDYQDGSFIDISDDEPFVFTGTMDGELAHTFTFQGSEGQWLDIDIYPRGLPSPGLRVAEPIGSWEHRLTPGLTSQPSITALVPSDDVFELVVSTFLNHDDHPEASGDASWKYVGTVEVVDAPEPVEWEELDETMAGDFASATPPILKVDVSEIDQILLTPTELGADVYEPRVEVWGKGDEYLDRIGLEVGEREEIDVVEWDEVYLYFQAVELLGPRTEFSVQAMSTETLPEDGYYQHEIWAEAGEVIFLSHRSAQAEPVAATVWLEQEQKYALDEILAENQYSYTSSTTKREFFYAPEDGDYMVEFHNTSGDDIEGFVSTTTVEQIPTFEVPDDEPAEFEAEVEAENLERGDWRFVLIETQAAGIFDITITAGSGNPRASVFDTERNELVDTSGSGGVAEMDLEVPEAGAYFVVSRPWSSITPVSGGLTFEIEGEAVDTVEPGGVHEVIVDADAFDALFGHISYGSGEEIELRLLNPHGALIFDKLTTEDEVELMELFPGPGEFVLEVENTGDEPLIGLDVELDVVTPLELLSPETTFSENYTLEALSEGERRAVVIQSQTDFMLDTTLLMADEEEAAARLWDVDNSEVVAEMEDEQRVDLERSISPGVYALEIEALTDIAAGAYLAVGGPEVKFVESERIHDPYLEIPSEDEGSSALSISDCAEILDVSIAMDMPSGTASQIYIDLYTPALDEPIALRQGSVGSLSTVYPDDTSPAESLEPLFGSAGDGVWYVEIENQHSWNDAELASWSVHLTCAKQ